MTPIANDFEDRLLDALLERFDTMANQPATRSSRAHRATIVRGTVAVGCVAAAATLTVAVLEPGGSAPVGHAGSPKGRAHATTPSGALAAWTSQPTLAAHTQVVAAENACAASFGQAAVSPGTSGQKGGPLEAGGPWSPVLVDTRNDLTLALYSDGPKFMACLNTSSFVWFTTVSTSADTGPVAANAASLDYMSIRGSSGDMFTIAVGRSGSTVTGVGLQRIDGSVVDATVGDGHFLAWWPEGGGVSALSAVTATGTQSYPVDQRFQQTSPPPGNHAVHQLTGGTQ